MPVLIQCEKCSTRYNLDESKIPGKGAKVTCPTCKNVFVVMKDGAPGAAPSAPPQMPMPTPTQPSGAPKSLLDSFFDDGKTVAGMVPPGTAAGAPRTPVPTPTSRSLRSWKVRVASGLVYDFTDPATLKTWIAEKKVTPQDSISEDGATWTTIGSIPNLDQFFGVAPSIPPASFGVPGPPPATGFGTAPGGPAAPAFGAAPSPGGPSLSDLFSMPPTPPPAAPSFNAAIPGSFAPPPPPPGGDPFAAMSAPTDPFASAPPPSNPFGSGTAPFSNPFGASPPPPPQFSDPFAGAPTSPGTPDPFATSKPAPPPWASAVAAPAPPAPSLAPPPPPPPAPRADADDGAWSSAAPEGAAPIPKTKPPRRGGLGRVVAIGLGVLVVGGLAAALGMNYERIMTALRPVPQPTATAEPPAVVTQLTGEARASYLAGRRYLKLDTLDAYTKAEASFRKALAAANMNPRATAGVLEALALQRAAGGTVTEEALDSARGLASSALKDDSRGVETNRAFAQYYAVVQRNDLALGYLETAIGGNPDDSESLHLRGSLRLLDPALAASGKDDILAAARDPALTRAHKAAVALYPAGSPQHKQAQAVYAQTQSTNATVLAALDAGAYRWEPAEVERYLGPEPTPVAVASETATPAPTATATATQVAVQTATPAPTPAVTATVAPTATPAAVVKVTATPVKTATPAPTMTSVAMISKTPTPRPTPTAAVEPTPDANAISMAGAEDHYIAGMALLQAGSVQDAIEELRQAASTSPKTAKYSVALGAALMRAGQRQEAAETLAGVIERDPNNPDAHRLLGFLFESTGQTVQACAEFDEYLRLAPRARDIADIKTRRIQNGCEG